jgi:hypothetical protein
MMAEILRASLSDALRMTALFFSVRRAGFELAVLEIPAR